MVGQLRLIAWHLVPRQDPYNVRVEPVAAPVAGVLDYVVLANGAPELFPEITFHLTPKLHDPSSSGFTPDAQLRTERITADTGKLFWCPKSVQVTDVKISEYAKQSVVRPFVRESLDTYQKLSGVEGNSYDRLNDV